MKQKKTVRKRHFLWLGLAGTFGLLLALSCYMIADALVRSSREQAALDALARAAEQQASQSVAAASSAGAVSSDVPAPEPEKVMLPKMTSLYEQNPDLAGWLTMPGTKIDYPVMYAPDNPEYYLSHAFDGTESKSGIPFIGAGGSPDSDCLIIHGHNMRNDTMFGSLDLFKSADFWKQNPVFRFDTLYTEQEYQIFAAVQTRILYQNEQGFRYYQAAGDLSEVQFAELTGWLADQTMYDTGVVPVYGDQILILSTCSYQVENGRFLVAARKMV